jgi:hypothetical protein
MSAIQFEVRNTHLFYVDDHDEPCSLINADIVTGIELEHAAPATIAALNPEYRYDVPFTLEFFFPDQINERLLRFYQAHFAQKAPNESEYDGHSFISYVQGWSDTVDPEGCGNMAYRFGDLVRTYRSGAAYCLMNSEGEGIHSLMGVDDNDRNLSIVGYNSDLIITDHVAITGLYGTSQVRELGLAPQATI